MTTQGTVKPWPEFNARGDCEAIKKAMKGMGCDSRGILNILCQRSSDQRQEIKTLFKTMYGKNIIEELEDELRGKVEDVLIALMFTRSEFDAHCLRQAMAGVGTKESVLIEILATRTNAEIVAIKEAYKRLFHRVLEEDIQSETSSDFRNLLVSLVQGNRNESLNVDRGQANRDARALQQAGEKKLGTDESTFNAIIASLSFPQLRQTFEEYKIVTGHGLEEAIKKEFSGDVKDCLLACVQVATNTPAFFAEKLHAAMKGFGTKDQQLIRLVVSRCEVDMVQIKQEFEKAYGKPLEKFIAGDTSGHYKEALDILVKGN